tara:strand:- start:649 stop:1686 length:1038 start_codon:yes stop_codon:yes gene_type:complete
MVFDFWASSDSIALAKVETWRGDLTDHGTLTFGHMNIEAGAYLSDGWQVAATQRQSSQYEYTPSTATAYHHLSNRALQAPSNFQGIDLKISQYQAHGFKVGKGLQYALGHYLYVNGEVFEAYQLTHGQITGTAELANENSYNYDVSVDYAYSQDRLFGRSSVNAPQGKGFSLGFALQGKVSNKLRYELQADDLVGAIFWPSAPYTLGSAVPAKIYLDDEGYLTSTPGISGLDGYRKLRQPLSARWQGKLTYVTQETSGTDYSLAWQSLFGRQQLGLGIAVGNVDEGKFDVTYWAYGHKRLDMRATIEHWSLQVGADQLAAKNRRNLQVSLSYNWSPAGGLARSVQ